MEYFFLQRGQGQQEMKLLVVIMMEIRTGSPQILRSVLVFCSSYFVIFIWSSPMSSKFCDSCSDFRGRSSVACVSTCFSYLSLNFLQ